MTAASAVQRTPEDTVRIMRSVRRQDFLAFLEKCVSTIDPGRKFKRSWHHQAIAKALKALEDGKAPPPHLHHAPALAQVHDDLAGVGGVHARALAGHEDHVPQLQRGPY